ncbi:MAG: hypothetical protein ACJ73D_06430 [Pyrinomonadaceae bacterium]
MRLNLVAAILVLVLGVACFGQDQKGGAHDSPKGEATIYFLWFKEWPQRRVLEIWFDDVELARLENSRYFGAKVEAGKHVFKTQNKGDDPMPLDLEAGKTYYVEARWVSGGLKGHHFLHLLEPRVGELILKDPNKAKLKKLDSDDTVDQTRVLP